MDILTREANNIVNAEGSVVARFEANNIILEDGAGGGTSYSTEEKKIGKWIDNSIIYRKVFSINVVGTGNNWINSGENIESKKIINAGVIESEGTFYPVSALNDSGILKFMHFRGVELSFNYIILDYTKEE